MKRIAIVLWNLIVVAGLVACGSDDGTTPSPDDGYTQQAVIDTVMVHDAVFGDSNIMIRYRCPAERCARIDVDYSYSADSDTIFMQVEMTVEPSSCSMGWPAAVREEVLVLEYDLLPGTGSIVFAYEREAGDPVGLDLYVYPASTLTNIVCDPSSPSTLQFSEAVMVSFDYYTPLPGGVRVWARGPGGGCGSPIYTEAMGSGTSCFNAPTSSQPVTVNSFELYMYSEEFEREVVRVRVPVNYVFQEW